MCPPTYDVQYTTKNIVLRNKTPKRGSYAPQFMARNMDEASLIAQNWINRRESGYTLTCDAIVIERESKERRQIQKEGKCLIDLTGKLLEEKSREK